MFPRSLSAAAQSCFSKPSWAWGDSVDEVGLVLGIRSVSDCCSSVQNAFDIENQDFAQAEPTHPRDPCFCQNRHLSFQYLPCPDLPTFAIWYSMQSSPKDFRSISQLVKSYPKQRSSLLQYCLEHSITPYLQGFDVRPRQYMRMLQIMPGDRDAETWGQPFDVPDPEQSTPISIGTLIDVPEEIESHFYQVPSRIWSELMTLSDAEEKFYWREVLWDERTEAGANWRKWNVEDILLLDPTFEIHTKEYHPLLLIHSDYIELENWLLKNPPTKLRDRDPSELSELEELIQRAYVSQLQKGNSRWRSVLLAMKDHVRAEDSIKIPRLLSDHPLKIELSIAGTNSTQILAISTFKRRLSEYRTGRRKITVTE